MTNSDLNNALNNCTCTCADNGNCRGINSLGKLGAEGKPFSLCCTLAADAYRCLCETPHIKAAPCGKNNASNIYVSLKKFFIFLRGMKKYGDKYINGTIKAVSNLQSEVSATITEIVGVLKTITQRAREWVLRKIKKGIDDLIYLTNPPQTKEATKSALSITLDKVFCKFDDIIDGLFEMVGDFLYSLMAQIINIPFCAVENYVNAILNKLLNDIDMAMKPFFDSINQALAPVSEVMGSVFQAIDFILGFEGFLCEQPECNEELKEFTAGPFGGPQNTKTDNWYNFNFSSGISQSATGWMDDFFGVGDPENTGYVSPGGCYSGSFECGVQVEFFGGGGAAAVGGAVVNNIGQIVGVNLFYPGFEYESSPFMSLVDPGGCGVGANGYPIIDGGEVTDVVITNTGIGYTDQVRSQPIIREFESVPDRVGVNNTVTLSWKTSNADKVRLNVEGLGDLPANGRRTINISENDVNFPAGKDETTKRYVLTAIKTFTDHPQNEVTRNIEIIVYKDENIESDPNDPINTDPPIIESFGADPEDPIQGSVVRFSWSTSNATEVSLGSYDEESDTSEIIYGGLVPNGSASLVIPLDIEFGEGETTKELYYTLTALNSKALSFENTSVEIIKLIVSKLIEDTTVDPNPDSIPEPETNPDIDVTGDVDDGAGDGDGAGDVTGDDDDGADDDVEDPSGDPDDDNDDDDGDFEDSPGGGEDDVNPNPIPPGTGGGNETPSGGSGGTSTPGGGDEDTGIPGDNDGETDSNQDGDGKDQNIIILPGITDPTGSGGDDDLTPEDPSQVVSQIGTIIIVNTGTGYDKDDDVEVEGNLDDKPEFELEVSPDGEIVNIRVVSSPKGYTVLPNIRINSRTGVGARFRSVLKFTPISDLKEDELEIIGTDKLLTVIDCISR